MLSAQHRCWLARKSDAPHRHRRGWTNGLAAGGHHASLEALEQRALLSVVTWDAGGNGISWQDPLNWSGDLLPGAADDAIIPATGQTIQFSSGVAAVQSLVSDSALNLGGGVFSAGSLQVNELLAIQSGATLQNSVVVPGTGPADMSIFGGTLDHVTLGSTVSVIGSVEITGGLVLNNLLTLRGNATFVGTQSLTGAGDIDLDQAGSSLKAQGDGTAAGAATLTIGPSINLRGGASSANPSTITVEHTAFDRIVNQGTVISEFSARYIHLSYVDNQGTIEAAGGNVRLTSGWTNTGTLRVSGGGMTLGTAFDPWTNAGALELLSAGTLYLLGSFTQADMGSFISTGGRSVWILGEFVGDMALSPTTGRFILLDGARFIRGTYTNSGAPELQIYSALLDQVTINSYATTNSTPIVVGGLTVNDQLRVYQYMNFSGSQTVSGTGTIDFSGALVRVKGDGTAAGAATLTVAPSVSLRHSTSSGTLSAYYPAYDRILNQGTIRSDGGIVTVSNVDNVGTITAAAGTLNLTSNWTSSGTLSVSGTGTLSIGTGTTPWSNAGGALNVSGGTLNLLGSVTQANLGTMSRSGGTVNVGGTFSGDLALSSATGSWNVVSGGILTSGTCTAASGQSLTLAAGSVLDQMTLNAPATVTGTMTITGGLGLNATLSLSNFAYFVGTQSITGTGEILFTSTSNGAFKVQGTGTAGGEATLTIGPGILVHGAGRTNAPGTISPENTGDRFLNYGTILADAGNMTMAAMSNYGTISASAGNITHQGTYTQLAGQTNVASGRSFGATLVTLNFQGGLLTGAGTVNGNLTNAADISPGTTAGVAGTLTLGGNFTQTSTGRLLVDLTSTGNDRLVVTGTSTAILAGKVVVSRSPSYVPATGALNTIVSANSVTGSFAAVENPNPLDPILYTTSYIPTAARLTAIHVVAHELAAQSSTVPVTMPIGVASAISSPVQSLSTVSLSPNSWQDTYYLSTDNVFDPGDVFVATLSEPAATLIPGATYSPTALTIPSDILPGNYYLLHVVNSNGALAEISLANNVGFQAVTTIYGAPVANAGGPYAVAEGASLTLDASASFHPALGQTALLTYTWDINGDGTFGDATGINPTLNWSQLLALGITNGPAAIGGLRVRATHPTAGSHTSGFVTLSVTNAPPSLVSFFGPSSVNRGTPVAFTLTATDPSPADQADIFTFQIDWDGDGTFDQTQGGLSSVGVGHTYPVAGLYQIRVTATDRNAGTSAVFTTPLEVYRGALSANGGESPANTTTLSDQTAPAVATDLFGNYLVAWVDATQDGPGNGSGIYAQVFNSSGGIARPEFRVHTTLASHQDQPAVAVAPHGNTVLVWRSGQNVGNDIYAKVLDRSGQLIRDEFLVNVGYVTDHQAQPSVAVDANGNFVIVWQSNAGQDGDNLGIFGQRYNAAGIPQGTMFGVNVTTAGVQDRPRVDMADNGAFVVTWRSLDQDGSGQGVYARRFSAAGVALDAADVLVNTTTTGDQTDPSVALDGAGNFVISWTSANQDGSGNGIYAQRFTSSGLALGAEFLVNQTTADDQQRSIVQSDAFGNFTIAWESNLQDGDGLGLYYRRFSSEGTALSSETPINSTFAGDQQALALGANGDGDLVAAWQSADASGQGVFAQRYRFTGFGNSLPTANAGGPYTLVEGQAVTLDASASADPNSDLLWYRWDLNSDGVFGDVVGRTPAITWQQLRDLNLSGINLNHLPQTLSVAVRVGDGTGPAVTSANTTLTLNPAPSLGNEMLVNTTTAGSQEAPAIASDAAGNYVVVWESPDASAKGVFARRYHADGTPAGAEFSVNTSYTSGDQFQPQVAMDAAGNFVIVWQSFGQDGNGFGIRGKRYDNTGTVVGSEFAVNGTTFDNQVRPAVALNYSGDAIVVWQSYGQDGDQHGIFGRLFDSSNAPLTGDFQVNQFTTGFQEFPKVAMDGSGNFVVVWTSGGNQDTNGQGIFGRRYNANGTPNGDEFQVNTFTAQNQFKSSVATDGAGNFVVAWTDVLADGNANGVFARRFNSSGSPFDLAEFQVNAYTPGLQQAPSLAMDSSGNWVIAYESQNQDGSNLGVYARTYGFYSGALDSGEFRVHQTTNNAQAAAAVTLSDTGQYIVAWQSIAQDGDQGGIYSRRFQHPNVPAFASQRPGDTGPLRQAIREAVIDAILARLAAQRDGDDGELGDDVARSDDPLGRQRPARRFVASLHDRALDSLLRP